MNARVESAHMGGDFAVRLDSYNRAENVIGNVLGTTGIHKSYENGPIRPFTGLGHGGTEGAVTVPSDSTRILHVAPVGEL